MIDTKELGKRIRHVRTRARVGVRELSRRANISPATLCAIERGGSYPSLVTLHKILKALDTSFAEFFSKAQEPEAPVFRTEEMQDLEDKYRRYRILLPKRQDIRFEMLHETIAPTEREGEWEVHDCDMAGVILSGDKARLEIEGMGQWVLKRGDSFYINAKHKHRLVNVGKRPIKQVTVVAPPRY